MPERDRFPVSRIAPPAARAPEADKPELGSPASTAGNQELLRALGVHDAQEREADRVAEDFASSAPAGSAGAEASGDRSGAALAPAVRQEYERYFRADLSGVRIHTDNVAHAAARALNAQAFALGPNVYFNRGRYSTTQPEGRKLLAHELTHVLRHGAGAPPQVRRKEDAPASSEAPASRYRRIHMRFNGSVLIVYGDGQELFRYGASSGRPIEISEEHARACGGDVRVDTYMSPRFTGIKNMGPIPEGAYRFSPPSIREFSTGEQLDLLWGGITGKDRVTVQGQGMHAGDWGAGRVALNPVRIVAGPCGNTHARGDFFLHGGLLAGSSGCIDIGTSFDELAAFLRGYRQAITVEVSYETETPRVGFLTGLGGALAYQGFQFRHGPALRLGAELGAQQPPRLVLSTEYQAVLDWAGGALTAGVHLDVPMNSQDAFVRAGLRGGAEFRVLHALYGQLSAGGFVESSTGASGYELGGGLRYDFGPVQLGALYNLLRSEPGLERHQVLLELGLRW